MDYHGHIYPSIPLWDHSPTINPPYHGCCPDSAESSRPRTRPDGAVSLVELDDVRVVQGQPRIGTLKKLRFYILYTVNIMYILYI